VLEDILNCSKYSFFRQENLHGKNREKSTSCIEYILCFLSRLKLRTKNLMNIIIEISINFNTFYKDYQEKYFKGVLRDSIRKELNIPDSDRLKKNGTFERGLYYEVGSDLRYSRIKIQTLLWQTACGEKKYISVFPAFIIKYNKVSTDLIELISTNVGKDEIVFKYIDDSGDLLECEDILVRSCERVEYSILSKRLAALLSARYTQTFNITISFIDFVRYKEINLRFRETYLLITAANICFEAQILHGASLSSLNEFFKFLR